MGDYSVKAVLSAVDRGFTSTLNNAGRSIDTLSGKIICDTECNPLHGPRVEEIIKKLEDGKDVDKKAYVEEEMFAYDDTVKSVKVDDKDYDVTKITQEILDKRAY